MQPFSVTAAMVAWLRGMGYEASLDVPVPMPAEFVTVERTGGGARDLVDHPLVAVQCWAATADAAEAYAYMVRLRVTTERPPAGIHAIHVNSGPYKFNDPETRRPRWQLALDVTCQLAI